MTSGRKKQCLYCKTNQPLHFFLIDNNTVDGLNDKCSECRKKIKNERNKKWRKF